MGRAGAAQLRERWSDESLLADGWAVLKGEQPAVELPEVEGRTDLRGIPAPPSATEVEPWRPPWIEGVSLERLDLSHAAFGKVRLMDVELRDCILDGADLSECIVRGGSWSQCRLTGATVSQAYLSGSTGSTTDGPRFRVEDCDLTKADLRKAHLVRAELTGVTFGSARMQGAVFTDVTFDSVAFAETDLREAWFGYHEMPASGVSIRMRDVDLSTAGLELAMLDGCVLDGCRFPAGTYLVPHYPAAVRAALGAAASDDADRQRIDEALGVSLRQGWAEETTGVILDPAPYKGHETRAGLALRVFRAAGVEIVEV